MMILEIDLNNEEIEKNFIIVDKKDNNFKSDKNKKQTKKICIKI